MFTGLITDIGIVEKIDGGRFRISCRYDPETIVPGASISCDGCCLTALNIATSEGGRTEFDADVSHETKQCTTLGQWQPGRKVNLERSLCLGDELGGHIVSGHVDCVAQIINITKDGLSKRFQFKVPGELKQFIASKGSVSIDGTSLTVNEVEDDVFGVNIIPHTLEVTTWGEKQIDDVVNLEVDLLARYVARIQAINS